MPVMALPGDGHVHSEWSWDTGGPTEAAGQMWRACERAAQIGLPAIAFTDHLDLDRQWRADPDDFVVRGKGLLNEAGFIRVPAVDFAGYLDGIDRCRRAFPGLRILTGVEFGQPHLWEREARALVDLDGLDRVNGSLHTLPFDGGRAEPKTLFRHRSPDEVLWAYLAEVPEMVKSDCPFTTFTHIDYAARYWPLPEAGPFDPRRFEDGFRQAMRAIAATGRSLEMNTRRLWSWVPQWWSEEGGRSITFGSDAHTPETLGDSFPEAAAMAEHFGFRPARQPEDPWTR